MKTFLPLSPIEVKGREKYEVDEILDSHVKNGSLEDTFIGKNMK